MAQSVSQSTCSSFSKALVVFINAAHFRAALRIYKTVGCSPTADVVSKFPDQHIMQRRFIFKRVIRDFISLEVVLNKKIIDL